MKSLKLLKAQCIQEVLPQTVAYLSQKGMDTSGADTELTQGVLIVGERSAPKKF